MKRNTKVKLKVQALLNFCDLSQNLGTVKERLFEPVLYLDL